MYRPSIVPGAGVGQSKFGGAGASRKTATVVYCVVMAKFSKMMTTTTTTKNMGVPNFMKGSLISYEIGGPRVSKILGNWGTMSRGPGVPILGESSFSLDTGPNFL